MYKFMEMVIWQCGISVPIGGVEITFFLLATLSTRQFFYAKIKLPY